MNFIEKKITIIHNATTKELLISMLYVNDELSFEKYFNFQRKSTEICSSVLNRIKQNINKTISKGKKRKKGKECVNDIVHDLHILSKEDNKLVKIDNVNCLEIFIVNANNYYLRIGHINYSFDVNPPLLTLLELPKKNIMAGFLIYPSKLEGLHCDVNDSLFKWYRTKDKFETYEMANVTDNKDLTWEEIGCGFKIFTSTDDSSRLLKVVGTPVNGGRTGTDSEAIFEDLISAGPGLCPFERRHTFTSRILSKDFLRVISYNILADMYADTDHARNNLFPTCPPYALAIEYRKQLFIKEILGYNADLICLQEVDEKVFMRDLQPVLFHYDLEGIYKTKGGLSVSEGLATFYNKKKLKLEEVCHFLLSDELNESPLFISLLEKIQPESKLYEAISKRTTILQVSIFTREQFPNQKLVVGVTHLYFEPVSDHIRLLQAGMCITILKQIMDLQKVQNPRNDVSLIFCGDFNSVPENAVYRLMTSQFIDDEDPDFGSKPGEEVKNVTFSHDLELSSACETPAYTNYTVGFNGCLDYIFFQNDKFSVEQVVPFPSHDEVTEHIALPSVTFPSDHISLVADLKWKNN